MSVILQGILDKSWCDRLGTRWGYGSEERAIDELKKHFAESASPTIERQVFSRTHIETDQQAMDELRNQQCIASLPDQQSFKGETTKPALAHQSFPEKFK